MPKVDTKFVSKSTNLGFIEMLHDLFDAGSIKIGISITTIPLLNPMK